MDLATLLPCRDIWHHDTNLVPCVLVENEVFTGRRQREFFDMRFGGFKAFYSTTPKHTPIQIDFENVVRRKHEGYLPFWRHCSTNLVRSGLSHLGQGL